MCGIAGILTKNPVTPEQLEQVRRMNNRLVHRGPDGGGEYHDQHIALAMRRLSIIDLKTGWQPLFNEDKTLVLITNGEIYNYVELRRELQARGHRFNTGSDCETILHLYEEHGRSCVHHLRGMFAFALWDTQRQHLLLARDRMGEKPLYLYEKDHCLYFASEMKALLQCGQIPFELDAVSVQEYFHFLFVPEPATPIKGVRKLPAAHTLYIHSPTWQIDEKQYWRMEDAPPIEGNAFSIIRQELESISEIVVRSDVPVGVALSGGIDSSAVTALAARKYPGALHAFSVGYPGQPDNDERPMAKRLADSLKIPFHDIELNTDEMTAFFPELVFWRDDPIADISGQGYYAVMKLARECNVPVVLQGQGGDELFWGYSWVKDAVQQSLRKQRLRQKGLLAFADYLTYNLPKSIRPGVLIRQIQQGISEYLRDCRLHPDEMLLYQLLQDFQDASQSMTNMYHPKFLEQTSHYQPGTRFRAPSPWPRVDLRMTRWISELYLLENGIAQGDRLSMASSVELRLPLVDHRLVETVIGLRKTQPDHLLPPKHWLKKALEDILPASVLNMPKKGFAPPAREWYGKLFKAYGNLLKDGYLVQNRVLTPQAGSYFSQGAISDHAIVPLSFKALVLEQWCRKMEA